MRLEYVWEHNENDTLLYAANFPGVYARGSSRASAQEKLVLDLGDYLRWLGKPVPKETAAVLVQDAACELQVCDADSDVLFDTEKAPLSYDEYSELKALAMKSAEDFYKLYRSIPDKETSDLPERKTFYGKVPATAEEMYQHTKNVNAYYFGEIGVNADNDGTICECRARGFEQLEKIPDFLDNPVLEGSYGESWTLRKMLRRFVWHDRIHAKAMYRMALRVFGERSVKNTFCF